MLDKTQDTPTVAAGRWLADFESALARPGPDEIGALFLADGHWRDALALSWEIRTISGAGAIAAALERYAARARPSGFGIAEGRTPPRSVTRAGVETIEAIFAFETVQGRGEGVLRLVPDAEGVLKAWTLFTALAELKGHEEAVGQARPRGESYSRDFHGPNWLDIRNAAAAYEDRDPAVLVVGAGQAGLSIAARLMQIGVDTLVIDRNARIGDNWRNRYHALTLHNQVQVNHLPYMPFPPNWPTYIPKDKLAGWFEAYAEAMELNVWTQTELEGGAYDEAAGTWSVRLRRGGGAMREMHPRHVVLATGVSGIANAPDIPGLETFAGEVMHSSAYRDGEDWRGRGAIVIGTGNSGHDIAQDLHASGAKVTLVQRSPTMIVNIEPSAQIPYALYDEGPPLEDCDLLAASTPMAVAKEAHRRITKRTSEIDRELLDGLERAGFRLAFGEDGTGWQFLYLTRGGGYYFNVGCSELVASGEIGLAQYDAIEGFTADGARLKAGGTIPADLVVLATGYKGQEALVRRLFGDAVAERAGPVWGFGEAQELRNMYTRTGQPGLWFIAGSLAQCRINSRYLALQIKACEEGIIPAGRG